MAEEKTSDELKQEYIRTMGDKLGDLYFHLREELILLFFRWFEFEELYAKKLSRIDLMNEVAPDFFRTVEDVLWESIVLGIARLTDPPKSRGKENLTICTIPDYINHEKFKEEIIISINKAKDECSFCLDHRNRRLAHLDYLVSTNKTAKPLELATVGKIKNALNSIADILNLVSNNLNNSTDAFDLTIRPLGNSNSLLYYIYFGLKAVNIREKRVTELQELLDDFHHPEI